MNTRLWKQFKFTSLLSALLVSSLTLNACGGGGSDTIAGIGGTGIVAGKATGFGSIYVNGSRFDTSQSQFIVDGDDITASQDDLAIGMYVILRVKTSDGNFTGEALEVFYDDEVQGPVAALPALVGGETKRTFTVFGQTVTIDETDTIFQGAPGNSGFSFDTISNNDVVEISGFRTAANAISASYVEWKETLVVGSEVELRGTIIGYNPPIEQFMLDTFAVNFDSMVTEIETPNGELSNGMYVEVKGTYQTGPVRVDADKIELEDEDFGINIDDISLHGVISNYVDSSNFEIDGQLINASGANPFPANAFSLLDDGVEVEVEGDIVGGTLIADELELRDGESELRTTVSLIDLTNNRFQVEYPTLGTVWVNTDGQTLFEDESAANVPNLSLDQLAIGNFVRVEGIAEAGEVTAETVKRRDLDSSKLQGAVESFNSDPFPDTSITILGIVYPIDMNADYEDGTLTREQFFSKPLQIGDIVELEDDEPDADADEVEFDDD